MNNQFDKTSKLNTFYSARLAFSFLTDYGYKLIYEFCSNNSSWSDGFELKYSKANLSIDIGYNEYDFIVTFSNKKIKTTYYFIDQELFGNASGYAGCMFDWNKVSKAIKDISNDIKVNYEKIILGDIDIWSKIQSKLEGLRKSSHKKFTIDRKREEADVAFRTEDYKKAVEIYNSLEVRTPIDEKRLEIAKRKVKALRQPEYNTEKEAGSWTIEKVYEKINNLDVREPLRKFAPQWSAIFINSAGKIVDVIRYKNRETAFDVREMKRYPGTFMIPAQPGMYEKVDDLTAKIEESILLMKDLLMKDLL